MIYFFKNSGLYISNFILYVELINSIPPSHIMHQVPFSSGSPRYHHRERDNLRHARSRAVCWSFSPRLSYRKISRAPPLLTHVGTGAGSVVVDFLYPSVDNDQHLPQWPESGGAETRS